MNMQIIMASLRARPVRTIVSVLAVSIEVVLILLIVGLATGMSADQGRRMAGIGADLMLQPPGSSIFAGFGKSVMPQSFASKIQELDGVQAVSPVLIQTNSESTIESIWGIDAPSFDAVSGGFTYQKGRVFSSDNEIVVDDVYAKKNRITVGDEIDLLKQKFTVSGIVDSGKAVRIFISLKKAEEMTFLAGSASAFLIKVKNADEIPLVTARLLAPDFLPEYTVRNLPEMVSLMVPANIPWMSEFIDAVVLISVCIGVLVIFMSMYMTITERTREIGILRSLGASRAFIVTLIVEESVMLCAFGIVIGVASSFLLVWVLKAIFATLVVDMTATWVFRAAISAVVSGVIGSLYPAIKAAAADPIEALAYE